jgi:radical SAM protein with 4Fe4S-binding SPASM domain
MMSYVEKRSLPIALGLPLEGSLDLTYRCNNDCRHCWIRIEPGAPEAHDELTLDQIRDIVDQARSLGTREWLISGGEPMVRTDFAEIFDYITRRATTYSLNTNGTLITPAIADLLRRKGRKMVALYGPNARVHDHITRNVGSFEATMRGMSYLREVGAGFIVQLIPMRDNYAHWNEMIELAQLYSPVWRCGSPWLFLSACGSPTKNAEIVQQRLSPAEVVSLDEPCVTYGERMAEISPTDDAICSLAAAGDDRLFGACISRASGFHIDPYGGMSFCQFIKDPRLRFDLTRGSVKTAWEEFIPSLADAVRGDDEWRNNCRSCENRPYCRCCAAYSYLETRRFSAPAPYLCQIAQEIKTYTEKWLARHRRYFEIADITIRVESRLPMDEVQFAPALLPFEVKEVGNDLVTVAHEFEIPNLDLMDLGVRFYSGAPWDAYRKADTITYVCKSDDHGLALPYQVATFSSDYRHGIIYNRPEAKEVIRKHGFENLTLFPTDQFLIAQLLASRQGCYMHAAGVVLDGQGLLFVGHSEAGKSTVTGMLSGHGEILCDDRIIVRRQKDGLRIFGAWSHGDAPDVSPKSAPLKAVLFVTKSRENRLNEVADRRERFGGLLSCLIKPIVTKEWWKQSLDLLDYMSVAAPCYEMRFDESGEIVPLLRELVSNEIC